MQSTLLLLAAVLLLVACEDDDPRIGPDNAGTPTTSTSSGGAPTTTPTGGGGTGGEAPTGGGGTGGEAPTGGGGTGGETSNIAGYITGSRLRARYYDAPDGSREYIGWHDSQLGTDCRYLSATDNSIRCLPWNQPGGNWLNTYTDAGCLSKVIWRQQGCSLPPYAVETIVDSCGAATHAAYSVGPQVYPSTVYSGQPGNCTAGSPLPGVNYYQLGSALPPSTFIEGTEIIE